MSFCGLIFYPRKAQLVFTRAKCMNDLPVSFPEWKEALAEAALTPATKTAFTREIISFLKHCKTGRAPATTELAKLYLAWRETQATGPASEALRWFFREVQKWMGGRGAIVT